MATVAAAEAVAAGKAAPASSSSSTHISLREEDVVKMACEFMNNRQLHISQESEFVVSILILPGHITCTCSHIIV